jgi:hypothetical protein
MLCNLSHDDGPSLSRTSNGAVPRPSDYGSTPTRRQDAKDACAVVPCQRTAKNTRFLGDLIEMWTGRILLMAWPFLRLVPVTTTAACMTTLNELAALEAIVTDYEAASVPRIYVLCPNTRFIVGRFDYSGRLVDGQDPLLLRPNMRVQCGDDGRRQNQCLLTTGDVLVDGTRKVAGASTTTTFETAPIVLQGLTFQDPGRHFVKLTQPWTVHLIDCEFTQAYRAIVPLLLDFYNPFPDNRQLSVHLRGCDLHNNRYAGAPAQAALLVATNFQSAITIEASRFSNNDMVANNTIVRYGACIGQANA